MTVFYLFMALILDKVFAEPKKFHPLVGFGNIASWLEIKLNNQSIFKGFIGWCLVVLPLVLLAYFLEKWLGAWLGAVFLYLAIGQQSLKQHAMEVFHSLKKNKVSTAATLAQRIVSRNMGNAKPKQIIKATTESVLENSNDAIFAPIFWFIVAGSAGVVLYRLVNTLDAMWGYKSERYFKFGRWAARVDDVMNWLPARMTVLLFAIIAWDLKIIRAAKRHKWYSPNAGPVMAAGAYALNVRLGGGAYYNGIYKYRRLLGTGNKVSQETIVESLHLINKSLVVLIGVAFCLSMAVS